MAPAASSHTWLRSALVVSEIAIALVLLTVSGALLRSFQKMLAVDPGFQPEHVLVAGYQLPLNQYSTHAAVDIFNRASSSGSRTSRELSPSVSLRSSRIRRLPPLAYTIEGEPVARWKLKFANLRNHLRRLLSRHGYSAARGRYLTLDDRADTPLVVIVNQSMARHCWPGESAIGKRMHVGNPQKALPWATVVGVVADTKLGARDEPAADQWYSSRQQPAILYGYRPRNAHPTLRWIYYTAFRAASRAADAHAALDRCLN